MKRWNGWKVGDKGRIKKILDDCPVIRKAGMLAEMVGKEFVVYDTKYMEDGMIDIEIEGCKGYALFCECWAEPLEGDAKPMVCTCTITALMSVGCKCGQIDRERKGV